MSSCSNLVFNLSFNWMKNSRLAGMSSASTNTRIKSSRKTSASCVQVPLDSLCLARDGAELLSQLKEGVGDQLVGDRPSVIELKR